MRAARAGIGRVDCHISQPPIAPEARALVKAAITLARRNHVCALRVLTPSGGSHARGVLSRALRSTPPCETISSFWPHRFNVRQAVSNFLIRGRLACLSRDRPSVHAVHLMIRPTD